MGVAGAPVLIWGAGAIGGSIGASLVTRGRDVLFVDCAQDHVEAMNRTGLRVTGPIEEIDTPVHATSPADVEGRFSLVLLCVKAHETRTAIRQLEPHVAETGAVVSVQNGLCELEIAERMGSGRTIGAFVNFGADYLEPGVIHRGNRGTVVVGELDGRVTRRIEDIHALFRQFEPDAIVSTNVFGYLWAKLAYAALLFATAVTDDSIADVLAEPEHRPLMKALAREVLDVAGAHGVVLEGFDGFDPLAFVRDAAPGQADRSLDDLVTFNRASAKTHSGIWRDLSVRKRATEVDAQLGVVAALGRESHVPTPLTEDLVRTVHEIESGDRQLHQDNLRELSRLIGPGAHG